MLLGWTFGIERLTQLVPGFTSMNPMTATSMWLAGASLLAARSRLGGMLAAAVIAITTAKLLQFGFGLPLRVDELLFTTQLENGGGSGRPSRMAPNAAVALLLVGVSLLLARARGERWRIASQVAAGGAAAIALFALIGYVLGMARLYEVRTFIPMALHTAVTLLVLPAGALSLHPHSGFMRVLRHDGPAGSLARMVLPLAVLVPVAVGLTRLVGQRAGWYGTEVGVALQVLANVVVTFVLLLGAIFALDRSDRARRRREVAVARSEAQYRLAETVAKVGHWRMDAESNELSWSAEIFGIVDLDPQGGVPAPADVLDLYHPDDRQAARAALIRALKTGEGWDFTTRLVRSTGEVRYVKSHGVCERDEEGAVTAVFGVFADITELETARRMAEQATDEKAAFLANMSHEVRTPLNSIIGFTDLLLEDPALDQGQRTQLNLIQNAGGALLTVVNDVLDFSKVGAGRIEFDIQPFAMAALIDNSVSIVRTAAEAKGLVLEVDVKDAVAPFVAGDESRLRQVLLNLLNNAVKFTNSGRIDLSVAAQPAGDGLQRLHFAVTDTGIGIPPEKQSGLFQKFSQADASVSRQYGGTGLGLAICKSLVELMGGKIGLSSRPGFGSTFWFEIELPISERPVLPVAPTFATAEAGAHILLVEDLPMNQDLACAILRRAGHSVDVTANGLEAMEAVKAQRYDLVLMDIQMPKMDGLTATRHIRAMPAPVGTLPIIAMTANVLPEQVREFRSIGMNDLVAKPIKQADLHRAIAAAMGGDAGNALEPAAEPAPADPIFDRAIFDKVAKLFPPERLETHLASFAGQVEAAFGEGDDRDLLRTVAHKLVSQAGMLGFMQLSAAARALEEACEGAGDIEPIRIRAQTSAEAAGARLAELTAAELSD